MCVTIKNPFNISLSKMSYIKRLDNNIDKITLYTILENEISKYVYSYTSASMLHSIENDMINIILVFYPKYSQKYLKENIKCVFKNLTIILMFGELIDIIDKPIDKHKIISKFREDKLKRILNN